VSDIQDWNFQQQVKYPHYHTFQQPQRPLKSRRIYRKLRVTNTVQLAVHHIVIKLKIKKWWWYEDSDNMNRFGALSCAGAGMLAVQPSVVDSRQRICVSPWSAIAVHIHHWSQHSQRPWRRSLVWRAQWRSVSRLNVSLCFHTFHNFLWSSAYVYRPSDLQYSLDPIHPRLHHSKLSSLLPLCTYSCRVPWTSIVVLTLFHPWCCEVSHAVSTTSRSLCSRNQ